VIVTKVGALRAADKSWPSALTKQELVDAVHDNLKRLHLEAMDIVNLRVGGVFGPSDDSVAEPLGVLADLQSRGLIKYLGLSNVSREQFEEGRAIAKIVCVQNHYNLAERRDDDFLVELATQGIAYVPYFPLGGFRPLKSPILDAAAVATGATTRQIALAWLLQRSPNILIIAGTSSVEHLRENLAAAELKLPPEVIAQLDQIASSAEPGANESGH
jgi:pyridoxine 4-dehydrogenase